MEQKPVLWGKVGARALRVRSVSREKVWAREFPTSLAVKSVSDKNSHVIYSPKSNILCNFAHINSSSVLMVEKHFSSANWTNRALLSANPQNSDKRREKPDGAVERGTARPHAERSRPSDITCPSLAHRGAF